MQFDQRQDALRSHLRSFAAQLDENMAPANTCADSKEALWDLLELARDGTETVKYQLYMKIEFEKDIDTETTIESNFTTKVRILLQSTDVKQDTAEAQAELLSRIDDFVKLGSGWQFRKILAYHVDLVNYPSLNAGCYSTLPKWIANKKAVINIKTKDNRCFAWAVLRALHEVDSTNSWYTANRLKRFLKTLHLQGMSFPVKIQDIAKFEQQNSISVSVFGVDDENTLLYPVHLTKRRQEKHANLLYYDDHFCCITNLNALLFRQTKNKNRKLVCPKCLSKFTTVEDVESHGTLCQDNVWQEIEMPKDAKLKFRSYGKILQDSRVVYADFECILEKLDAPCGGVTKRIAQHTPCGAAFVEVLQCCKNQQPTIGKTFIERGPDCVEKFLDGLVSLANDLSNEVHSRKKGFKKLPEDQQDFTSSLVCHICKGELSEDRVMDHCHFCGKYRGAAHGECNLDNQARKELTVVFHNLRKYDGHLILQRVGKLAEQMNLKFECIPKGMADYLTFSVQCKNWKIRFIDSFQFLACPLSTLVENMKGEEEKFRCMKALFPNHHNLLRRKGVYMYEYMDSFAKFDETELPGKDAFFSSLTSTGISEEDHQHAKRVFQTMNMNNLGDYHDTYLLTDVALLADVFESFRNFARENYNLEPTRYITLPSYGWDALLLTTKAELELIMDEDMYAFIEKGMRGGISTIVHRYAKANNPLVDGYDATKPKSYILYLDANNLYGWAMTQALPMGNFRWASTAIEEVLAQPGDAENGFIVDVDLEYPAAIHDQHNDFPLAAEHIQITEDMVSPYCLQQSDKTGRGTKLVPNLYPKSNYVLHYRVLQQCVRLGLKVTRLNRVLAFRQGAWMKPYILKNTAMRSAAKTDFEKDLFKLLNNAVFGKSMENVRKYADVRLVSDLHALTKLARNPRFDAFQIFHENLAAIKMVRRKIELCKPIYTGFAVLDLSKMLMANFHYDIIKATYGDHAQLLFTDTDSLCYLIQTEDVYDDMLGRLELYDTSNYTPEHQLHSTMNKKVIGKMKDETAGVPIEEFVGLRAKMYSMKYGDQEKSTAKGVVKSVRKKLKHETYKATLENVSRRRDTMPMIRNQGHEVFTIEVNKISLSAYDNKRYIHDDGVSSFAYGHCRINT